MLVLNVKFVRPVFGDMVRNFLAFTIGAASLVFCLYNVYGNEPVIDFRPYKIGNDINDLRKEKKAAKVEMVFVYQSNKTHQPKEFTYDEVMAETKLWYNGYSWGKEKVYNPFSIACLFKHEAFKNYWFTSGAPRFLIEILFKNFNYRLHKDKALETTLALGFGSESINTTALMFQTGYLTITDYNWRSRIYTLDFPNKEVEESLQMFMLQTFAYNDSVEKIIVIEMYQALVENNMADFIRHTNQLFAQIPEPIFIANRESFYHAIIYLSLALVGITARSEEHTNIGRIDMVIALADRIFIIEYKIADTATGAMEQIHTKKYYEKYLHEQKAITLVGIALGATQRGIVDWIVEEIV